MVWTDFLIGCIETGMASEVKALLREKADDRHEIIFKRLAENLPNPSLDWLVQAGLLDTQQPKFKGCLVGILLRQAALQQGHGSCDPPWVGSTSIISSCLAILRAMGRRQGQAC